jgi:hypothetical protein
VVQRLQKSGAGSRPSGNRECPGRVRQLGVRRLVPEIFLENVEPKIFISEVILLVIF